MNNTKKNKLYSSVRARQGGSVNVRSQRFRPRSSTFRFNCLPNEEEIKTLRKFIYRSKNKQKSEKK